MCCRGTTATPFDRLLVAQAQVDDLTLVTGDPQLSAYDVPILWSCRATWTLAAVAAVPYVRGTHGEGR